MLTCRGLHARQCLAHEACECQQVVIPGALGPKDERPDRADVATLIAAGGGTVLPMAGALRAHVDFAVVRGDAHRSDTHVQKLLKAKVVAASSAETMACLGSHTVPFAGSRHDTAQRAFLNSSYVACLLGYLQCSAGVNAAVVCSGMLSGHVSFASRCDKAEHRSRDLTWCMHLCCMLQLAVA